VRADLGTSHAEPSPKDGKPGDAPISTTRVGTRIHQVRLRPKIDDMPRKAGGKCRAPTVLTCLVPVSEAVDPHPRHSIPHYVGEENIGKQVQDPCPAVVPNCLVVCKLRAVSKLCPKPGDQNSSSASPSVTHLTLEECLNSCSLAF
jgi:hypothetical protein